MNGVYSIHTPTHPKGTAMQTSAVITLARKHLGNGAVMESSARLCLADAVELFDAGQFDLARERAQKSLSYSVGILHPAYCATLD
jgi:hypothetical protein